MTRSQMLLAWGIIWLVSASVTAADTDPDASGVAFFEAKVRPLLVEHCYKCHSASAEKVRGGLLLDTKEGLERGGDSGPGVVPGKPEESLLIEAVRYDDPAYQMPPKGKLPDESIAVLVDWVGRGAPDPRASPVAPAKKGRVIDLAAEGRHWAYQPLASVEPPAVADPSRVQNPIDRFVFAKQAEAGLLPNEPNSRRVLIRRLSLDLTGLPPTPEEVAAFLADDRPYAYEALADRLLASPRFGERWARHWLDLARWAESHGFEHDYDRPSAYTYRDFVIEAFNADLPFDTFARWQIAGDELEPENPLALKATGFLAAGTHSTQITANQVEKERYDELDDMTHITGTAFLGLTFGCARCHDHKFDPIPQKDYYRLAATFTTTVRSEVDLDLDPEGYRRAVAVHEAEHRPYVDRLSAFESDELPSRLRDWEDARPRPAPRPKWVVLDAFKMESKGGATLTKTPEGAIVASGPNAEFDTYTITTACDLPAISGVRLEALANPSFTKGGPGRAPNGNFALTDLRLTIGPRYGIGKTESASLINPQATFEQPGLPIAAAIDADPKSGWAVDPRFGEDQEAVFEIGEDVRPDGGATLTFTLDFRNNAGHNLGKFRLSATAAPRPVGLGEGGVPPKIAALLEVPIDRRTDPQASEVLAWYRTIDPEWRALNAAAEQHARAAPKPRGEKALIATEGLPAVRLHTQGADFLNETHLLRRGDPNQKLEVVEPGFLQVLSRAPESTWKTTPPPGWRTSYRRAGLANWLTDTESGAGNLLARVIVNRLWQHHMGQGIVATPSDFGKQGEPPSHPELLDWLASELIRGGWRLKPIHRLIITSAAYRQSSHIDPAKASLDPENKFLWRHPRMRLEAEAIRDSMLFVAGKLDERMYGPGSLDDRMFRRSVYFTIKRSQIIPMMALFDAPDALTGQAVRGQTTVPPQSLLLMNSPIVRDWAAAFAERVKPEGSAEARVQSAYEIALGRPPDPVELRDAIAFLESQARFHEANGREGGLGAALVDFCQALLALNEFVFVE